MTSRATTDLCSRRSFQNTPSNIKLISPKRTRHPSLEPQPAIPTGQEILAQLDQLTGANALSGNKISTIGRGRQGRTNASDSRPESPSLEEGAQSSEKVDEHVATSPRPLTPPRLTPPTPAPPIYTPRPATPTLAPAPAPPIVAPPPAVEVPISRVYATGLRSLRNGKLCSMELCPKSRRRAIQEKEGPGRVGQEGQDCCRKHDNSNKEQSGSSQCRQK